MGTAAILDRDSLEEVLISSSSGIRQPLPRATGDDLPSLGAFDFARRIPDDLLVRTDRATMGASIEARVPFLDQDLVELVPSLPRQARAVLGISKVALRVIAWRWGVPWQTIAHRKIGFQIPLGRWFRGPLQPMWARILDDRAVPGLNYDFIGRLFDAHLRAEGHFEEILWRVAALELWHRQWIQGVSPDTLCSASSRGTG